MLDNQQYPAGGKRTGNGSVVDHLNQPSIGMSNNVESGAILASNAKGSQLDHNKPLISGEGYITLN